MNRHEFEFILQEGEGLKNEFKEKIADIDKELVALANSSGGRIFVGVDDVGKVIGINVANKLKSQIQDENVPEKVTENVPEKQQKIVALISKNKLITISELAQGIGIDERNIKKNLDQLKQKGLVKRIGPDKGGYWEVQQP